MPDYDDIVVGAGMGGLTVASLLARAGRRVLVLEAHDAPGGYAHTFRLRDYRFCAQVHYIFNCGEGESVHAFLARLGLAEEVPFVRLDPEGFDHVVVRGERVRIPNGWSKFRERMVRRFPEAEGPLRAYFRAVANVADELDHLEIPASITPWALAKGALAARHVLRDLRSTLADVFDRVRMPRRLRAFLAGQCGDYLLPPRDVSFLLHVALVTGYDRGAYYPEKHFYHFVDRVCDRLRASPGSALRLETEVERFHVAGGRVTGVSTKGGRRFTAERYISNVDPRVTSTLLEGGALGAADTPFLDYDYSCGTFTMYLAVRGIDLRDHGFGSHNVWHYPHEDLDRIYDDQLLRHDLSDPWLFLSTPTLHSAAPGLCPEGEQILEVATACDHARWAALRARDRRAYNREKKALRDRILERLEADYVPGLHDHLTLRVAGTPATNARFCRAPEGNAYGAALTPRNMGVHRRPFRTSLENLYMVNATAGFPSVAGVIGAGIRLYGDLTGDDVLGTADRARA